MMGQRSIDAIATDLEQTGDELAAAERAVDAKRARLTKLYIEGARRGMTPSEMARRAGVEPGTVRATLSVQRKAGKQIPHGRKGVAAQA